MKWISTLTLEDIEVLKNIIKQAEEEKKDKTTFQSSEFDVSYLKAVIKIVEATQPTALSDDMMDLEINNE